jgi:hypothetical protein
MLFVVDKNGAIRFLVKEWAGKERQGEASWELHLCRKPTHGKLWGTGCWFREWSCQNRGGFDLQNS